MTRKEFTEAVKRYINNGWEIYRTFDNIETNSRIEFAKFSEDGTQMSILQLCIFEGVRIKNTNINWNYTEWSELNGLTLSL
jgi:hypothetical protein